MSDRKKTKVQLLEELEAQQRRIAVLEKINARKGKTIEGLKEVERQYRLLVENIGDVIWIRDFNLRFTYLSPSVVQLTGFTPEEAMALPLEKVYTPELIHKAAQAFQEELALEAGGKKKRHRTRKLEMEGFARDGSRVWTELVMTFLRDSKGTPIGILGISRDVTERKRYLEQIHQSAFYDFLTGLPNRRLLADRFHLAKGQSRRAQKGLGLLLLDLDRFKEVNDRWGHLFGDKLLKAVGHRLAGLLRHVDTVARMGGDEFVILLPEIARAEDAGKVAEKIREAFQVPFRVDGQDLFITTSLGLAVFPQDGEELEELLKKSDIALYRAKDQGRNSFQYYR